MATVVLVALQILLLLLRAYFGQRDNDEKALEHLREAQLKFDRLASQIEAKFRFSSPPQEGVSRIADLLDSEEKRHGK